MTYERALRNQRLLRMCRDTRINIQNQATRRHVLPGGCVLLTIVWWPQEGVSPVAPGGCHEWPLGGVTGGTQT